jgi:DNA-binding transcriptional MerR regulator
VLIGEIAESAGVPARTVRFYERRGLLPEPRRMPNGYRVYDDTTLTRLRFIRAAQSAGLTLEEIRGIIELREGGSVPCSHVERLLADKRREVRQRRRQLGLLEQELASILDRSQGLDPRDCSDDDVCHILTVKPVA